MSAAESEPLFGLQIGKNKMRVSLPDLLTFLKNSRRNIGIAIRLFRNESFITAGDLARHGITIPQLHRVERGKASDNTIYRVADAVWKMTPWNTFNREALEKRSLAEQMNSIVMMHGFQVGVRLSEKLTIYYDPVAQRKYAIIRIYDGKKEIKSFKVRRRSFGKIENSRTLIEYLDKEHNVSPPLARYALHTLRSSVS